MADKAKDKLRDKVKAAADAITGDEEKKTEEPSPFKKHAVREGATEEEKTQQEQTEAKQPEKE